MKNRQRFFLALSVAGFFYLKGKSMKLEEQIKLQAMVDTKNLDAYEAALLLINDAHRLP